MFDGLVLFGRSTEGITIEIKKMQNAKDKYILSFDSIVPGVHFISTRKFAEEIAKSCSLCKIQVPRCLVKSILIKPI